MENKVNSSNPSDDETFCFNIFHRVSRSFAFVTEVLEEPLRTTVSIFYLILRGLDTIEDDLIEETMKAKAIESFTTIFNERPSRPDVCQLRFRPECNQSYVELMENFDKVLNVFFSRCTSDAKKIIRDIVNEMAGGMIKYSAQSIDTLKDYNEYCYYVAGLVGIGLTNLFHLNGEFRMEEMCRARLKHLAISTGSFLQKVNILRDIYEDLNQPSGRSFYPAEVWKNYVKSARDLIDENYRVEAIACLNYLINDAFQHLPDSIEYMSRVTDKGIFRFIAIPQCIAVATLEKMFNNPAVFSSNVKIGRTEKENIFENVVDMKSCLSVIGSCLDTFSTRLDFVTGSCSKNWIFESVNFVSNYKI
ncbi:squalene synthase 8-like [Bradysia coprophila]|uniref:squalene synthase 8-like n=1 Tax=Bradysia coprophila TaxID=38358 RepID=UPI00187D978A|nr:squalene synthase 8-like [Bradysia coprophila]